MTTTLTWFLPQMPSENNSPFPLTGVLVDWCFTVQLWPIKHPSTRGTGSLAERAIPTQLHPPAEVLCAVGVSGPAAGGIPGAQLAQQGAPDAKGMDLICPEHTLYFFYNVCLTCTVLKVCLN